MRSRSSISRSPARIAGRAALCVLPWLVLGAACLNEDDAPEEDDGAGGSNAVVQTETSNGGGGAGGSEAQTAGSGGRVGTSPAAGGGGGSSPLGGSGSTAQGGSSSSSEEFPAAPGETGIFVGMTAAHNAARADLMADPPLPDLTWSQDLADFSQEWADELASDENCGTIFHRDQRMYGENIAFRASTNRNLQYFPEQAVEGWVAEVDCWDYGTILGNRTPTANSESCDATCVARQNSTGCGHYTQVVWRNTRQLGCGYSTCEYEGFTAHVWVCNYNPPGNFVGQVPY
jgi:pathogenesis-related protein 1